MAASRIGLFGGSFNPPHVAHLAVAEAAREQARLDRVLWVPASRSPLKDNGEDPGASHRLEMTRLAIEGQAGFEVCALEVERGGTSYTVGTVGAIARRFPSASLYLILGGDSLASFERWKEPRRILEQASLVVYRRPGDGVEDAALPSWIRERAVFLDTPRIELSATEIRRVLAEGRSGRYLVPDPVLAYINRLQLYRRSAPRG